MRHDNLEQFIRENREAFDEGVPSLKVWAEIDRRVNGRESRRLGVWRSLRVAAGVLMLLFAGAVAGRYIGQAGAGPEVALETIAPEYVEMANYYESQINQKKQQLANYRQGEAVLRDFAQLDRTMEELREELLRAPKGREEQIIENLIKTYQTKVQILERVLERIQSTHQEQTKPAENEVSI